MYEIGSDYDLVGDDYDLVGEEEEEEEYYADYEDEGELDALLGQRMIPTRRGAMIRRLRRPARRPARRRAPRRAYPTRRAVQRQARYVAEAVKRVDSGTLLKKTEPTKSREFPIGFDSGAAPLIAAGAAATLTQRPQILFRPERIVVPAAVAAFFVLTDVRVGKNSQLVSAGNIPAATFSETAFGVRLKMDTCQISQDLILQVTNIDVAGHRFLASVIGESVE